MMQRRTFLRWSMLSLASSALPLATLHGQQDQTQSGQSTAENDPSRITHKDADGLEYRECPQCGFNMYRQDRTWTSENCGYSYSE